LGVVVANISDLIGSIAALLWVVFAFVAILILRGVLKGNRGPLTRLGLGPSGVTVEFAEAKIDEAVRISGKQTGQAVGAVAKRSVIDRLQRNSDLLQRARILWADDHPEYNVPIVELLRQYGASVDTPKSNENALNLLRAKRYDVVISDVSRDNEGLGSHLKGVELAEQVFEGWGMRSLLFTMRFNPATLPGATDAERLKLVERLQRCVFAITNRTDEALHYVLDLLER
jgi:CheY-like chemotaxis protein